jgi:TatD DNase family protein
MAQVIDTHCHLDFEDFSPELPAVLDRARAAGIAAMVCIGSGRDVASARNAVNLAAREPDVWATVGVHPHDVARMTEDDWTALGELARQPRVVGIGESGLDYHYDHSPRPEQQAAFRRFIAMARQARLPVISHVRDAHADALAILREENADDVGGIIHCFTGGVEDARGYLDMGHHLSFSGILTFKNAEAIREAARFAPMDRILIETDAPYLAPIPYRGKRNEPAYITETLSKLAACKGVSVDDMATVTSDNARRVLRLVDS